MRLRIFTFLVMFLATMSGAVWGQATQTETKCGLKVTGPANSFEFFEKTKLLQIHEGGITITNEKANEAADCKITINCSVYSDPSQPAIITLDNVFLKPTTDNATPISILNNSDVTLIIKGENTIESPEVHKNTLDDGILQAIDNASLTIKTEDDGVLNIINNGPYKNAIGGKNAKITIASGTIKTNYGGIGGTDSEVTINEGVKIKMTNPKEGVSAKTATIDGADITIIYNDQSQNSDNSIDKGIALAASGSNTAVLNMSDTKLTVMDSRSIKKAIGIQGVNKYNATITNCNIVMNVEKGIYSTASGSFAIKDNSLIDIEASGDAISFTQLNTNVEVSNESIVYLKSNGENACGIKFKYTGNLVMNKTNAYVVADAENGIIADQTLASKGFVSTDRSNWKGIIFERDKELEGILSGYVYGDITMQTKNFELKDNYHLIYCNPDKAKLTIGENGDFKNNGHIFIAYDSQDQDIENSISGNGAYHYEVFYDESVNVPEELKGNLKDAIQSEELMRKQNHPNAEERTEMIFGENKKNITLSLAEEYADYVFTFKVKTEKDGISVPVNGNSFTMPSEAVRVYDIKIEKKVEKYTATVSDEIETTQGDVAIATEGTTTKRAEFEEGATVDLIISEKAGYELDRLYYINETGDEVEIDGVGFNMPASDVIIYAVFKLESQSGDEEVDDEGTSGTSRKRFRLFLANKDYFPKNCEEYYELEALELFSRHNKKYTHIGGSFTIWYEKDSVPNDGNYRIFWSKSANGEYKEVKFDEVSEYYQIRDVHSNVFVKIFYENGFPVANEEISATDARAYAQANKIVVITPEPTDVQIISMAGAVVATDQVTGQREFANLMEGIYIVRMGDTVVKLQVRN